MENMWMNKWVSIALAAILLCLMLGAGCGRTVTTTVIETVTVTSNIITTTTVTTSSPPAYQTTSPYEWLVQVWEQDTLMGSGIVVGDGNQVLTAIDFSSVSPEDMNLTVIAQGYGEYKAIVQVIDSRTCAALLRLEDADLPVAPVSTTATPAQKQPVDLYGWEGATSSSRARAAMFSELHHLITDAKYDFDIAYWLADDGTSTLPPFYTYTFDTYGPLPGAAVTDANGKVIGMLGVYLNAFGHPTPPGFKTITISINSALKLLSPDATQQPWANGPLEYIYASGSGSNSRAAYNMYDYAGFATTLQEVFGKMGEPVPASDLPKLYSILGDPDDAAHTLTLVYASPVELRDSSGNVLTSAKRVSLYYEDKNSPAFLYYGSSEGIEGGFTMLVDVSEIEAIIPY